MNNSLAPKPSTQVPNLILLRHGETAFNAEDRFAGQIDIPLNAAGFDQARRVADDLLARGLLPDIVFTSPLSRARVTAELVLAANGRPIRPVVAWPLVERHYGALQGRRRADVLADVGTERFQAWRRSWHARPPSAVQGRVRGESMQDVAERLLPYWIRIVEPQLEAGCSVLVVSHGNALRVIQRHLEHLTENDVAARELALAAHLRYRWCRGTALNTPEYHKDPQRREPVGAPGCV